MAADKIIIIRGDVKEILIGLKLKAQKRNIDVNV